MATQEELIAKLEGIVSKLTAHVATGGDSVPAYDRPEIGPDQVTAFDGNTHQKDGSIWSVFEGKKYRAQLGYISPKKFPIIFETARKIYGDDRLEREWEKAKYTVFKYDPRPSIFEGTVNFMNFGILLQSLGSKEVVQ